jgi:CO dehydrogenase nickel-insertion accessory protein CooC1
MTQNHSEVTLTMMLMMPIIWRHHLITGCACPDDAVITRLLHVLMAPQ